MDGEVGVETVKRADDPKRFPAAISLWAYDEAKGQSFIVVQMELARPDYKENPHGFNGNHLVRAVLAEARERAEALIPEGVQIVTSRLEWNGLIHGPGYRERKAQRALARLVPKEAQAAPKAKTRL